MALGKRRLTQLVFILLTYIGVLGLTWADAGVDRGYITTVHYSFTAGGAEQKKYSFVCDRQTCAAPNFRIPITPMLNLLNRPRSSAREGFSQIVSQKWLDATAESAYERLSKIYNYPPQPAVQQAFIKLYRDRSAVLQLVADAYRPSLPNVDEYFLVTVSLQGKKNIVFRSQKTLLPFLLPFTIATNGRETSSYDPALAKLISKALPPNDPLRPLLTGADFASFVASVVWERTAKAAAKIPR